MARIRKLTMAGINIVTHPHSPQGYVRLLKKTFDLRQTAAIRASQHMMIGELRLYSDNDPQHRLTGRIYRFLQIDKNAPWFNVARHDVATDAELRRINIPDELRPNTEMFDFVFYPRGHTLYFDTHSNAARASEQKTLSAGQVGKMLNILFSHVEILHEFGQVEVTVLPEREQLELILSIYQLNKLTIEVTRPNPDELGAAQARVFTRLGNLKARKAKYELTAESGESITPDDETKQIALVAASNGFVIGHGRDRAGLIVTESTKDKPWGQQVPYNPEVEVSTEVLVAATEKLPGHG
ncbi:MAG TPA: DUF4747 family protein [Paucimonas sp.]|nr:DUF4747 family protein [Paucimonas sp.]